MINRAARETNGRIYSTSVEMDTSSNCGLVEITVPRSVSCEDTITQFDLRIKPVVVLLGVVPIEFEGAGCEMGEVGLGDGVLGDVIHGTIF